MSLKFKVFNHPREVPKKGNLLGILIRDNWDDFSFKTSFNLLIFDENNTKTDIGRIKIGMVGQEEKSQVELPNQFSQLHDNFFSLGQDVSFYEKIKELNDELKENLLESLNDIVWNANFLELALKEEVTNFSLMRNVSLTSINGQFKRVINGGAILTEYRFKYEKEIKDDIISPFSIDFQVTPESMPPTNIHVLIGSNGVGKTKLLNSMIASIVSEDKVFGEFIETSEKQDKNFYLFSSLVFVSFSAFDIPKNSIKNISKKIKYTLVGGDKALNSPINQFTESIVNCLRNGKKKLWLESIRNLETDYLFKETEFENKLTHIKDENELKCKAEEIFKDLSSGHGIIALTITKIVEIIEERTLILMDEPEGHLHPPLLSAFMRTLSNILIHRNAIAIIATHSPIILQEVPKSCVWKIRRKGNNIKFERPQIETFGENVGTLTREVFGLEVTNTGYHNLLREKIEKVENEKCENSFINTDDSEEDSYDLVLRVFNNQLGMEAKAILRCLVHDQKGEKKSEL